MYMCVHVSPAHGHYLDTGALTVLCWALCERTALPQAEAFPATSWSLANQGEIMHTAGAQQMLSEQVDETKRIIPYLKK